MAKEMPHSIEAEQSILGAMLVYPSLVRTVVDQDLHAEEFYVEAHQRIFGCMMDLHENGQNVDVTTLITRLNDTSQLALVGGADYVIKLSDSAVSSANGVFYIDIIKQRYHLRRLIETAEKIAEEGFDSSSSLDDVLDHAEKEILEVTRSRRASEFQSSKEVVGRVIKELVALRESDNHITGVRTGYQDLDRMTNGFQRGDLIILAARPAMGKTALALNLGMYTALRNPGAVAFFSLEMPAESLMKRLLSAKSQVEGNKLRGGNISDDELNRLNEAGNELGAAKIFIDDSASIKVSQIFSKCRKLMSEYGLSLIVIDYLQLISGSGRGGGDNRPAGSQRNFKKP